MAFLRAPPHQTLTKSLYIFVSAAWRARQTAEENERRGLLCCAWPKGRWHYSPGRRASMQVTKLFTAFASISKELVREPGLFSFDRRQPLRVESELNHQIYPGHQTLHALAKTPERTHRERWKIHFDGAEQKCKSALTWGKARSKFTCFYIQDFMRSHKHNTFSSSRIVHHCNN
jgi:hypothetical protein